MINSLVALGIVFLTLFSLFSFINGEPSLGRLLGFFATASILNIFVLNRWRDIGLIGITIIIYSLSMLLVYSGGYENTGMLWIYPLAAIGIFINRFKQGVVLTLLFMSVLTVLLFGFSTEATYTTVVSIRFILTLTALCGMCHILIFFQSKSDDYIFKMHEEGIHKLAYYDGLTQLANRTTFRSILYHSVQKATYPRSAILCIDLDNFKSVNDNYGHDRGDSLLADFGLFLKQVTTYHIGEDNIGQYDIARLGGDEFAIYVENANDRTKILALASGIIDGFTEESLPSLQDIKHELSASIGIVLVSSGVIDLVSSMTLADQAMYQAKKAGKGRYRVIES